MNPKKFFAVIIVLCLWCPSPAQAYNQARALGGLKGVKVTVQYFNPALARLLMPKDELEKDIEKKMKKLGVPVLKHPKPPAMTTLFVNIKTIDVSSKGIVYYVSLVMMEWAYLKREPGSAGDLMEVRAINWYEGRVGFLKAGSIKDILGVTDKMVQNFIYDYLSVNK